MVVTTLPATGLLPRLRKALVREVSAVQDGLQNLQSKVRGCLERISIARVFDIEGLWEVLGELEAGVSVADARPPPDGPKADDTSSKERAGGQKPQRTEIMDSEDEGGLSSPEASSTEEVPSKLDAHHDTSPTPQNTRPSSLPDMILITHTSALLNALFTGRDKEAAHNAMLLLSSHLRSLTRSPSLGGPLIMFLNSTASPSSAHHADGTAAPGTDGHRPAKHVEQTLCSIFNPPPSSTGGQQPFPAMRNKPSFGLVFSQMLDLHLLCTRVPRTRADYAALMAGTEAALADVSYVWAVEVLLDETGVYEESGAGEKWRRRRSREQRWAAVDVDDEGRVVDAFP
jgi:hypothetical protein